MKSGHDSDRTGRREGAGSARRRSGPSFLTSVSLGAGLMYLFDPVRGRRRRALARDQIAHWGRVLREARRVTAVDVANRAQGLRAEWERWMRNDSDRSDQAVAARVRAKLGRVVSHPHAISVSVRDGVVTLSGPILAHEVQPLLSCARKVAGVLTVEDRLAAHEDARGVSSLQGGRPRIGDRFELMQRNWAPATRFATGLAGTALLMAGARNRGMVNFLLGVAGGALIARAATNREFATLVGAGAACRAIDVQKTINVNAPVERVFEFWQDYQNFPSFMSRVREVQPIDEQRSRWVVAGPGGTAVEWTSELTRVVPNERIEWHCEAGSSVRHEGVVRFDSNGNGGTRVTVHLRYIPVAGAIGHAVARLFGADPKSEMDADLMRMKTMVETGHRPHDAAARRPSGVVPTPAMPAM